MVHLPLSRPGLVLVSCVHMLNCKATLPFLPFRSITELCLLRVVCVVRGSHGHGLGDDLVTCLIRGRLGRYHRREQWQCRAQGPAAGDRSSRAALRRGLAGICIPPREGGETWRKGEGGRDYVVHDFRSGASGPVTASRPRPLLHRDHGPRTTLSGEPERYTCNRLCELYLGSSPVASGSSRRCGTFCNPSNGVPQAESRLRRAQNSSGGRGRRGRGRPNPERWSPFRRWRVARAHVV